MSIIHGILFLTSLTSAAFVIWLSMEPIGILLIFLHSNRIIKYRRKYLNQLGGLFLDFAAALLTRFIGSTKLYLYSDNIEINYEPNTINKDGEIGLIISNHRTRIDWMYAGWCYCSILRCNAKLHVILKDSLRHMIVYGWAMQLLQYIFLTRDREKDIPYLVRSISYLLRTAAAPIFLIFPEGTDLSDSNKAKSHAYAKAKDMPILDHVLYPKSGALAASIQCMRGRGLVMHDMTIAYVDPILGQRITENDILLGRFPKEVHMFVTCYKIDDLPSDRAELDKWLKELFYKKEVLLQDFYHQLSQHQCYTYASTISSSSPIISSLDPSLHHIANDIIIPHPISYPNTNPSYPVLQIMMMIIILMLLLMISIWMRWLCTFFIIIAVAAKFANGYDSLELALHCDMVLSSSTIPFHHHHHSNSNSSNSLNKLVENHKTK